MLWVFHVARHSQGDRCGQQIGYRKLVDAMVQSLGSKAAVVYFVSNFKHTIGNGLGLT